MLQKPHLIVRLRLCVYVFQFSSTWMTWVPLIFVFLLRVFVFASFALWFWFQFQFSLISCVDFSVINFILSIESFQTNVTQWWLYAPRFSGIIELFGCNIHIVEFDAESLHVVPLVKRTRVVEEWGERKWPNIAASVAIRAGCTWWVI